MRVVAVEDVQNAEPIEAILVDDEKVEQHPDRAYLAWWQNYAWETLETSSAMRILDGEGGWRLLEMELPDDWEEGYLRAVDGVVEFEYGQVPPERRRPDWKWS